MYLYLLFFNVSHPLLVVKLTNLFLNIKPNTSTVKQTLFQFHCYHIQAGILQNEPLFEVSSSQKHMNLLIKTNKNTKLSLCLVKSLRFMMLQSFSEQSSC